MGRERKCILCHIVYNSKQEMDEHMRSMLHHRELENLKGRDCDHECRVCRVSVVGLTEYASHISSTLHKQRVEAQEQESAGEDPEEEYFDKELVELIERRKELIRKEEEAAKQEERLKQQHQRYEERQRLQQNRGPQDWGSPRFPPPPRGRGMSNWQGNGPGWNPARAHKGGVWNPDDGSRNWYPSQQSRSATWHAEGPPNFPNWHSEQREGGSLGTGGVWGTKWQGYQGFPPNQRGQPSWSNRGSDNNLNWGSQYYWEHTKEPLLEGVESQLQIDFADDQLPLSGAIHFNKGDEGHLQIHQDHAKGNLSQKGVSQSKERSLGESSRGKERTTKNSSNTPKDKVNRWAPYPPAKLGEIPTQKKANVSLSESYPPVPQMQVKDRELNLNLAQGATRLQRFSRKEQGENHQSSPSPRTEQGEEREHRKSGSSSRRDSQTLLSLSTLRAASSSEQITSRASSTSSLRPYHRASSRDLELSDSSKPPSTSSGSPQNDRPDLEDQQSVEILGKAKDFAQNKRNLSTAHHTMETVLHIVEDQEAERMSSTTRIDREEKPRKERGSPKNKNPDRTRSHFFREEAFRQSDIPTDTLSLQSIQVSTSTLETLGSAVCSVREEEDKENDRDQVEENEAARQVMQAVDEGLDLDSDLPEDNQDEPRSVGAVPDLRKLGLPASLKRDLTRHMSSKTKAGAHEPNLNIARRFRNVSGTRKSDLEKDSGLKPTLRQLISCSASRRNVNWDQVYQEISKKKQEQGKGMPRFGIEMVTQLNYDHEVGSQEEEEDVPLTEGFQWESLCETQSVFGTATPRKRSLSESSLATDRAAAALSIFKASKPLVDPPSDHPCGQSIERVNRIPIPEHVDLETQKEGQGSIKLKDDPDGHQRVIQGPDSVDGDSSCTSGAEQNDMQGAGKKRRAAGEIPSPEIPSLERKNKRRKIKPKKERSPVDQLLAVSLREEELSSSLQAVDSGLIQARATLQAAYMEVQRLLVVKQQVSMEMSSLRSKRIALLQGMQEGYEDMAQPGTKNSAEASATATTASTLHSPFSPLTDTPACSPSLPCPSSPPHFPYRAVPPSSLSPSHPTSATTASLNIKKEPLSPSSMHTDPAGRPLTDQHRKTLEPHCTTSDTVPTQSTCGSPSGLKAEPHNISHDSHGSVHVSSEPSQDCSSVSKISASDHMELGETPATRASQQISTQAEFQPPPSSSLPEPKSGKRVRRLKKKKVLRKALGNEHLDNSDTEQDGEASIRPVRRIKSKRKGKAPQVSTSIPVTMGEEHAGDKEMKEGPGKTSPSSKPKQEKEPSGSDSPLEAVELPQVTPTEVISIDLTDSEDSADIRSSAVRKSPVTLRDPTPIGMEKLEPQKLAFDEVSSTSELGPSTRSKDHISKTQQPLSSLNISKKSLDMSSEQGDEEEPTEGTFEGHQAAVNSMQIHSGLLYTCSGDRTVRAFNLVSRKCVAVFEGHNTKVNCLQVSSGPGLQQRLYTGASDQTIRCYSLKTRECLEQFSLSDRVLCLHSRWKVLYAGLGNGSVVSFSLKTNRQLDVFECHGPRAVSCLASAQEGARRLLLVGSYDCTISVRDAKNGVLLRTLEGHAKTVLCMKVVNDLVFSGSSDQCIHAYNIHTGELVRIYKGHSHAVTVVNIVGKVMITACLDKLVRVYELQSQDRLQVYGGHKDMVMCMAVHKGMIYTGCYDGSVQAFRLNLIHKYRCWWHGCSMVFGVMGHLQQHLLADHTSPKFQTLKCRWKSCDALFTVRNNSKQDVPKHMQKHAEEESKLEG